jgi:putative peptidoglycan lipid II flippase
VTVLETGGIAPEAMSDAPSERTPAPRLARAAALVMAAFVLSRVLGLVREMVIAQQFGASRALDAYRAAFSLPDLIFTLVIGGALGSAFIPTFTAYLARRDEDEAWRVASSVFNLALLGLTASAGVVFLLAPWLVPLIVPGFRDDPESLALTTDLVRIMLLSPILGGLSGIVMGVLNSYQRFLLPALAPVMYNLGIIGGALWLAPTMGVRGLAVGVAAGAALHLLIQLPGLAAVKPAYRPILGLHNPGVREVGRLMLPRVLGLAAMQLNYVVNTILASLLRAGSLAALTFAWQLTTLPWGVIAMAISTVSFPALAAAAAREEMDSLKATLSTALRTILYLTIPAGVGLFVLREPLVALLFQRGQFDAASTQTVAFALAFYAPGLFALAVTEILTRAYYALHDTRTPVLIAVATVAANVALSLAFIGPLAHGGLALAATLANSGEAVVLIVLLRRRLAGLDDYRVITSAARAIFAALVMGLALTWLWSALTGLLDVTAAPALLAAVIIAVGAGAAVYGGLTWLMGSPELARLPGLRRSPSIRRRRLLTRPYLYRRR